MKPNRFTPTFASLPAAIPIFPLPRAILLPHAQLPLNIFEPRYLNMTLDALGSDRMIGMIQPDPSGDAADVYEVGCAGRITAFNETDDGRLLIVLTGVCRFRVAEELASTRGYRRVRPDWRKFPRDLEEHEVTGIDLPELIQTVRRYLELQELEADLQSLARLPGELLINHLAMNLPFDPEEKQVLVEAMTPSERGRTLMTLCDITSLNQGATNKAWH